MSNENWKLETDALNIYVLDTSVLIYNPTCVGSFGDALLVIPMVVLDELDKLKRDPGPTGRAARAVIRYLNSYFIHEEVSEDSPQIKIQVHPYRTDDSFGNNSADNLIINVCKFLIQGNPGKTIQLVTKDLNLGLKASQFLIRTKDYVEEYVDTAEIYSGHVSIAVEDSLFDTFHSSGLYVEDLPPAQRVGLLPNIGVTLIKESKSGQTGLAICKNGRLDKLSRGTGKMSKIKARNKEQRFAASLLMDRGIDLITLTGPAGVGKTLLAVAAGLQQVMTGFYDKLLVSRPIQPLGKDLGYLPGNIDEKLDPWMSPIRDAIELAVGADRYYSLISRGVLEVEPLTYIRGRSIPNVFFILDESQQLSRHELKTILTRMGTGSKIILTGDILQIDHPYLDSHNNGLTQVLEAFRNEPAAGHISLVKGERSPLATLSARLL